MKTKVFFRLNEIMAEKKRGARELAKASNVGLATISRIINNRTRGVSLLVIEKLCKELKVSPGELFKVEKNERK